MATLHFALSVLLAPQVSRGRFRWFYKVLGLPGASGRGLRGSSLARLILVDFGGHFEAHFGSFLECILEVLCKSIIILMHYMMVCNMIYFSLSSLCVMLENHLQ